MQHQSAVDGYPSANRGLMGLESECVGMCVLASVCVSVRVVSVRACVFSGALKRGRQRETEEICELVNKYVF